MFQFKSLPGPREIILVKTIEDFKYEKYLHEVLNYIDVHLQGTEKCQNGRNCLNSI